MYCMFVDLLDSLRSLENKDLGKLLLCMNCNLLDKVNKMCRRIGSCRSMRCIWYNHMMNILMGSSSLRLVGMGNCRINKMWMMCNCSSGNCIASIDCLISSNLYYMNTLLQHMSGKY